MGREYCSGRGEKERHTSDGTQRRGPVDAVKRSLAC
jgi:hypothetical protein